MKEQDLTNLGMGILVVDLCQQPVNPVISGQEDGVILSWFLLELDGNGNQLVISIHVQQTDWSRAVVVIPARKAIHYLHVTDVHTTSLKKTLLYSVLHLHSIL